MGEKTAIAWTDATWNPVVGCSHVSDGCTHCYAERLALRFGWSKSKWTAENAHENVVLHPERLGKPLHWHKPRMVFVNSMSDLFHEQVPFESIYQVFTTMSLAPQHTYQILTKRPKRALEFFEQRARASIGGRATFFNVFPAANPNIWIGVSVENQRAADERIPLLQQIPAGVRFLSCEPLLEGIDLRLFERTEHYYCEEGSDDDAIPTHRCKAPIDWVIAGGESGPAFRAMNLDWARSLRDQCVAARVPFFYKQSAGPRPGIDPLLDGAQWHEFPVMGQFGESQRVKPVDS